MLSVTAPGTTTLALLLLTVTFVREDAVPVRPIVHVDVPDALKLVSEQLTELNWTAVVKFSVNP